MHEIMFYDYYTGVLRKPANNMGILENLEEDHAILGETTVDHAGNKSILTVRFESKEYYDWWVLRTS